MLDFVKTETTQRTLIVNVQCKGRFPRPLLIGISIFCSGDTLVIMGGGAVCFSFGTYWNPGCFTLGLQMIPSNERSPSPRNSEYHRSILDTWKFLQMVEMFAPGSLKTHVGRSSISNGEGKVALVNIQRTRLSSTVDFSTIVSLAKPAILEGLELGSCTKTWTSTYLKDCIGRDNKVRSEGMIKS